MLQVSPWRVRVEVRSGRLDREGVRCVADVEVRSAKTEACEGKKKVSIKQ